MVQNEKVREEFAQRLALACREAGLDDHGRGMAIARALRVSAKAVSKWLNAESLPRQEKINELARFLRVDVLWLQHGRGGMDTPSLGDDGTQLYSRSSGAVVGLTKEQEDLLRIFDALPKAEADRFLAEMKARWSYFQAIFEEMSGKLGQQPPKE